MNDIDIPKDMKPYELVVKTYSESIAQKFLMRLDSWLCTIHYSVIALIEQIDFLSLEGFETFFAFLYLQRKEFLLLKPPTN